jgi:hypothetical protein
MEKKREENFEKQLEFDLKNMKIHNKENKHNIDDEENEEEVLDLLNEKIEESNNSLNKPIDEKEEIDDDEEIDKEFNDFMSSLNKENSANQFLNDISTIMEKGSFENNDDFLNSFEEKNYEAFSKNLFYKFVKKDIIYQPLKEAEKNTEELIKKEEKNKKKNIEKLNLIKEIIKIFDKNADDIDVKDKIIEKLEKINDKGGIPEEFIKAFIKQNPELKNLEDFSDQKFCKIF